MSYNWKRPNATGLERICMEEGESIEQMLRRLTANNEPIPANVPLIYTPKADGVLAAYDIRTDRMDVALQAKDKFTASQIAQSANKVEPDEKQTDEEDFTYLTEE